jgi:hypothetical protein
VGAATGGNIAVKFWIWEFSMLGNEADGGEKVYPVRLGVTVGLLAARTAHE